MTFPHRDRLQRYNPFPKYVFGFIVLVSGDGQLDAANGASASGCMFDESGSHSIRLSLNPTRAQGPLGLAVGPPHLAEYIMRSRSLALLEAWTVVDRRPCLVALQTRKLTVTAPTMTTLKKKVRKILQQSLWPAHSCGVVEYSVEQSNRGVYTPGW